MLDTLKHQENQLDTLHRAMAERHFLVLTGAGISTSSGIPDYRDSDGVRRGKAPMMYQEFLATAQARRRYWARAMLGWPRVRIAQPNKAHLALATLQQRGRISGLITQNVDTLHDQAGTHDVIELHGSLHRVLCLDCQLRSARDAIQRQMEIDNPYLAQVHAVQAPDGDTLLDPAFEEHFQVPHCPHCNGERLKPDVVFFGENVAPATAARAMAAVGHAEGLLVVGSSLMAYSAFRLCKAMVEQGKPVIAINLGKTRADELLQVKIEAECERLLPRLVERLR
ncbi:MULTISPECIES: NAD-dependent protein deacetylase [Pseudomonas]|jgi:NAD-dependent SIR2 family protein deacetylase|uniref:NAD-dependent protein deacetylase n=1 Tax=Pseudomonas extremorientalis TaxID=169669 RepID=A0A1H0WDB3_9PSED|nr:MULTISPECIES: NAD-dependent protein deacetylase [Pseudomonas]KAB0516898.1 NAD-dependent protein deacetylase [Pseudomonas extremorientalis]OIN09866.1 NAD-dependent deacetylase [Pseudomonas extremorientalis]QZP23253.1 NAD-dependent protein deacetylase [Pseudomonas sp. DR208]UUN90780.1 NAD-dependent protein deacetylase [Pseudomonas extremorientalis]WLG58935.1 NAD-dependent protein deacetylase [Pseudomonas extremorientalis]